MNRVSRFISPEYSFKNNRILPFGFLQTGPGSTSNDVLFTQVREIAKDSKDITFAILDSSQCHSLRALLRTLIESITRVGHSEDGTTNVEQARGPRLLHYDLQILHNWCRAHDVKRCVIALPNSEALSTHVLTDFLCLLRFVPILSTVVLFSNLQDSSWRDRIDFALLFGVASSVNLFCKRIPRSILKRIRGRIFPLMREKNMFNEVFTHAFFGAGVPLRMGPSFCEMFLQRQSEHFCNIETFTQSLEVSVFGEPN